MAAAERVMVAGRDRPDTPAPVTLVPLAGAAAAAVVAAVMVGAAAQAVTGFAFSLVCAPVLVVAMGARPGVQLTNLLAIVINLSLLAREWPGVRIGDAVGLLIPAVAVTPAAAYVVHRTDAGVLSVVAGCLIAASAVALAAGVRVARLSGVGGAVIAGAISSVMNTAGGVGGPAAAMYGTNASWPPESVRPTLQLYFLGLNVVTVVALGPARVPVGVAAAILAALAGGLVIGSLLARRLPAGVVRRAILALSFLGGLVAIGRGIFIFG